MQERMQHICEALKTRVASLINENRLEECRLLLEDLEDLIGQWDEQFSPKIR
jgi:hypothetical protein